MCVSVFVLLFHAQFRLQCEENVSKNALKTYLGTGTHRFSYAQKYASRSGPRPRTKEAAGLR